MEKIIHQIWVGEFKIPLREQKLSSQLKEIHNDYDYMLWRKPPEMPINVKLVYDKFFQIKNYAFCADVLRIYLIYKYGGFYLDIDFDIKKKLDPLFEHDSILFYHNDTDFTIPNNLIAGTKGASHLKYCLDSMDEQCSWAGPSWLGATIKKYLNLPYESPQSLVMHSLNAHNVHYHEYWSFEKEYGRHLSLYSWEPCTWRRLLNNEQL